LLELSQSNESRQAFLFPDVWHKRKALIEALLFVSPEPVSAANLAKVAEIKEYEVGELVDALISEYNGRVSGILIVKIAGGYQMVTNPEYSANVRKLKNINMSNRLSQAALETLTIVAYKQPLTKLEIDNIRGVNSEGAVKSLLDKKLIRIIGKKETPGRPFLYGTTKVFLNHFGLKDLASLPPIGDYIND
jgi:segregation and condensation protein B